MNERKMCTFGSGYFHMAKTTELQALAAKVGVSSLFYREIHDIVLSVMSVAYTGKGLDTFDLHSKIFKIIKAKENMNAVTNTKP